jgi:hypothetical protein
MLYVYKEKTALGKNGWDDMINNFSVSIIQKANIPFATINPGG